VEDAEGKTIGKLKEKFELSGGEQEVVIANVLDTVSVFGTHECKVKLELEAKGLEQIKLAVNFLVSGPPLPTIEIGELSLFNPQANSADFYAAGDEFIIEGEFSVSGNESGRAPRLILYALMEDDSFLLDPFYESQSYNNHWDSRTIEQAEGTTSFRARGRLPYYFAEPLEYRHPFRVYAIVSFGAAAQEFKFISAELNDGDYGEARRSEDVAERLIEMDRSVNWEVRRGSTLEREEDPLE
jgi:hypothetical protein